MGKGAPHAHKGPITGLTLHKQSHVTNSCPAVENSGLACPKESRVNEIDLKNDKVPIAQDAEFSLLRKTVTHCEYFPLLNNLSSFIGILNQ